MAAAVELPLALQSIAETLLIGLLVGIQREGIHSATVRHKAGVRDFVLIAVSGGICGLLQVSWLTVAALLAITILVAVFAFKESAPDAGVTTELATVTTFCLGFLTAYPGIPSGAVVAIGTTIVVVALLEAKKNLHKLIREGITEPEFNGTLRFLAVIFIIYPLLPAGKFGPYGFFEARRIWIFVILVSTISYAGYFLQKFLGEGKGLKLTGVLGGLASTTAATASFGKGVAEEPQQLGAYWQATVIANTVQFPRVLALLYVMNPQLASRSVPALAAMTAAGLVFAWILSRRPAEASPEHKVPMGNPFRLIPALKYGAVFAALLFLSKAAAARYGGQAVLATSALGGSVDVDSISVAVADLTGAGGLPLEQAVASVLIALLANAILKTVLAGVEGGRAFATRVAAGFAAMFAAGAAVYLLL